MKHKNILQLLFYGVMCLLGAFVVIQVCMYVPLRYILPALLISATIWPILEVVIGEFIFKE